MKKLQSNIENSNSLYVTDKVKQNQKNLTMTTMFGEGYCFLRI